MSGKNRTKEYMEEYLEDEDYYEEEEYYEEESYPTEENNRKYEVNENRENQEEEMKINYKEIEKKCWNQGRKVISTKYSKQEVVLKLQELNYNIDSTIEYFINIDLAEQKRKQLLYKRAKKEKQEDKRKESKRILTGEEEVKVLREGEIDVKCKTHEELNEIYPKLERKDIIYEAETTKHLNLVIIGHVDSGKSTTMGHLLYKLGYVTHQKLHEYKRESAKIGKKTFEFAWVMDENNTERDKGVTINIAIKSFKTQNSLVTLIDAPGHRDFIPNMITGAAQADTALLIIDSGKSSFEAGFYFGGQTKEHSILARSLGVTQIVVCINKLDLMEWSKEQYDMIVSQVDPFLQSIGFKGKNIRYIPISGLLGENLTSPPTEDKLKEWYEGQTLLQMIDSFHLQGRKTNLPTRACINDAYTATIGDLIGSTISVKIEGGIIADGDKLLLLPLGVILTVKGILTAGDRLPYVLAGNTAEIALNFPPKFDIQHIFSGMVLSSQKYPTNCVTYIKVQLLTFELKIPLLRGQTVIFHCHAVKISGKILKIEKIFSPKGEKTNPKCIPSNRTAVVQLVLDKKVCLELYANYKNMGRIALRDHTGTLATGIILELIK